MNDLIQRVIDFYDNGFYYPNVFLLTAGILSLAAFAVSIVILKILRTAIRFLRWYFVGRKSVKLGVALKTFVKRYSGRFAKALGILLFWYSKIRKPVVKRYAAIILKIQRAPLSLFVMLLLFIVLTRVGVTYGDKSRVATAPESIFALPRTGIDLYLAVLKPALKMMNGENFYYYTANYGPSFTLAIIPPMMVAQAFGLCVIPCTEVLYGGLLTLSIVGYLWLIIYLFLRDAASRNILVLFLISFLLGIPGSLGLERGNIDIIHPVLFGLILLLLRYDAKKINQYEAIARSIVIGFLAAFITNSKLFFLPMALVAIVGSPRVIAALGSGILWYGLFSYLPNVFGAASSIIDPFKVALVFEKVMTFVGHGSIEYNHSFAATASIFTDCIWKQTCIVYVDDVSVITLVSRLLFIFVFILPLFTAKVIRQRVIYEFRRFIDRKFGVIDIFFALRRAINQLVFKRHSYRFIIFYFIIATALANLILKYSFNYRLYYSLPLIIVLWKITIEFEQARWYLLLSMIFLLMKGAWIFTTLNPYGMDPFEPRGMNIFVMLHFYYLMKTGLALLTEHHVSFVKRKKQGGDV